MITIWKLILEIMVTSFLALLTIAIIAPIIKWLLTTTWLNAILPKNKRFIYFILAFAVFSMPIVFSLITDQALLLVIFLFIRELLISVIIVLTIWVTWVFTENPRHAKQAFLVALLRILVNAERKNFLKGIQVFFSDEEPLDFFAIEYWSLKRLLRESMFNNCLGICQIDVQDSPVDQDIKLYDTRNPDDYRIISLEDHKLIVSSKSTERDYQNYNVKEELLTLQKLSRLKVALSERLESS